MLNRSWLIFSKITCMSKGRSVNFTCQDFRFLDMLSAPKLDTNKVIAVTTWSTTATVKDLQIFLAFTNYCRKLIHRLSSVNFTRLKNKSSHDSSLYHSPHLKVDVKVVIMIGVTVPKIHIEPQASPGRYFIYFLFFF